MAKTYTWEIKSLDVYKEKNSLKDVVYQIHYMYKCVSNDEFDENNNPYEASLIGSLLTGEPDSENYIEFDDLKSSDVKSWLIEALNVEEFKISLSNEINEMVTPTKERKNVPW
ncbi:MAG: hypothetical protein GOVbin3171_46 [Prokaryotic dsDNA virus sp.]|nr:MAG: hypothetical protein GOVbin3171_46 [Prokaryotic dsDNA virus sp.]|tara:strand:- start:606 stop:944 length:339 start_codon:yes stop_codon:yes gene_type:complete